MPIIQSAVNPNAYAQPRKTGGAQRFGMAGSATSFNSHASDGFRFSGQAEYRQDIVATHFSTGEKWKGGGKAMLKSLTNWKWWAKEGAIACGITVATCWLPGSQLFTIPLWLGISGVFTHGKAFMDGFRNPNAADAMDVAKAQERQSSRHNREGWSKTQIAKAMAKGAWDYGKRTFMLKNGDLLQNLGISTLLTLATCWLPGSQLLTIPAWFCMDAAIKAGMGGYHGWQDPAHYLAPRH